MSLKMKFVQIGKIGLLFGTILLVFTCAHKVAPTGGPPDKTPPQVLRSFPAPDSVNVGQIEFIEIEFSEAIQKTSLLRNYWIVPEIENGFRIKWKGNRRVRFYFKSNLEPDQTYLFSLGTNIKDLHRNALTDPFQLAFSTGASLDSASISGGVFAEQAPKNVYIYAYPGSGGAWQDSLLRERARYYTQIGKDGFFRFIRLPLGNYRVFALQDKDFDRTYSVGSDGIGIPFMDVHLDSVHPDFANLNFYLIEEDTLPPQIRSAKAVTCRRVDIRFTEPLRFSRTLQVQIQDSSGTKTILPRAISFDESKGDVLTVLCDSLPAEQSFLITVRTISDLAGNFPADSALTGKFVGVAGKDTMSAKITGFHPASGTSNVPYDSDIRVSANVPLDTAEFQKSFVLRSGENDTTVGKFDFRNLFQPVFKPDTLLKKNTTYTIELHLDSLGTVFAEPFPDTVLQSQFTTYDWADLGEISGVVRVPDSTWRQAIIFARSLRGDHRYQTVSETGREYLLKYLPAGKYLLHAVIDRNRNQRWDKGQTVEWQFAEPFLFRPDTVQVRRRWTRQGIDFRFNFQGK
ncbi:MAG TPA: hypothetical protein ENK14_07395 [Caldithrix sp.]|nr:hypothetical protein [Caldithrix sp.]